MVRDAHGIPHIYADTAADLMRAQGFVHAQERFYEMDVRRHATAGRLAELFGEPALESDRFVRTMAWRRIAAEELALIEPETRAALERTRTASTPTSRSGTLDISVQYTILDAGGLGYRPEPWTPVDSLSWLKAMAWDLRSNMDDEIGRALSIASVGPEAHRGPLPRLRLRRAPADRRPGSGRRRGLRAGGGGARPAQRPAWVADAPAVAGVLAGLAAGIDAMPAYLGRGDGIGSNSWSSTASTPRPAHRSWPTTRTWASHAGHLGAAGPALPHGLGGVPARRLGVHVQRRAGRDRRPQPDIAWGFTNLRRTSPTSTSSGCATTSGSVRGSGARWRRAPKPSRSRGRTTSPHHPVQPARAVALRRLGGPGRRRGQGPGRPDRRRRRGEFALALQWTALEPARTADAIFALGRARTGTSSAPRRRLFKVPAQNLVYADGEGHIGYQAPGRIPVRSPATTAGCRSPGWMPEYDWTGESSRSRRCRGCSTPTRVSSSPPTTP